MLRKRLLIWLLAAVSACGVTHAQTPGLAATPPMGWNSWDSYGLTIDEAQFRANAEVLARKLAPLGWKYAVLDEGWYFRNPESRPHPEQLEYELDPNGRFIPVPERFPSSAASGPTAAGSLRKDGQSFVQAQTRGFEEMGRWLHGQGLQFGIHIIRGIPKESVRLNLPIADSAFTAVQAADQADACPWDPTSWGIRDNAAGQAWYDSLLRQYAGWGVDFLKVDCIADHPYKASEIRQIRRAIERSGRPMVLSLSPGPMGLDHVQEVSELAQMWRISDDVWDVWGGTQAFPASVVSQFQRLAAWAPYARPGNWPDADMLPLGRLAPRPEIGPGARASRLSAVEQRTQMTLWSIARSPLIFGGNLTMLDDATLALLSNADVIRVNQTAMASRQVAREGDLVVWSADLPATPRGAKALAVFNLAETTMTRTMRTGEFGATFHSAKEVWTGKEYASPSITLELPPHGAALLLLK